MGFTSHTLIILRKQFVRLRLQSWDREDGLRGTKWKSICWTITSAHKKSNLFINSKNISLFWVWLNSEAKSFFSPLTLFSLHCLTDRQTGGQTDRQADRQTDRRTDRQTKRLRISLARRLNRWVLLVYYKEYTWNKRTYYIPCISSTYSQIIKSLMQSSHKT